MYPLKTVTGTIFINPLQLLYVQHSNSKVVVKFKGSHDCMFEFNFENSNQAKKSVDYFYSLLPS
jgi:hypothetical protein